MRPTRADLVNLGGRDDVPWRPIWILLAAVWLVVPVLRADVFWHIAKRADSVLQQLGGLCVYTTDAQLNGAAGTLSAYSFSDSASQVRGGLTRALDLPSEAALGGALMTHVEKDRMRRLLVLPASASEAACVVLLFDQSLKDAARVKQNPPPWPSSLPAVAGTPLFSAVCAATGTSFGVAETDAEPQAAAQETAEALSRAGWLEVPPSAATSAVRIFNSGKKISVLFASRRAPGERTTISVLQREGATP